MDINKEWINHVTESIKLVVDLTSRIDERIKNIAEDSKKKDERLDRILDQQTNLTARITVLEAKNYNGIKQDIHELKSECKEIDVGIHDFSQRIATLEVQNTNANAKWKTAFDFCIKVVWTIITCWLLMKLGLHRD